MVETFLKTYERPPKLNSKYTWVGKCRKSDKGKGGIGLCLNSDFPLLDDNLLNSKLDEHERLWNLSRIGNVKTALGVVYFPNDGVNKPITDSLMFELLENCTEFSHLGYETILMGDVLINVNFLIYIECVILIHITVADYANLLKQVNCT